MVIFTTNPPNMPENPEKRTDKAHTKDLMNQASTPAMTRPTLSRRFSVAPMMDWTVNSLELFFVGFTHLFNFSFTTFLPLPSR